ncbi:hypothetical protein BH11ACT3_BH11ACT3_13910 [soil metagenome]
MTDIPTIPDALETDVFITRAFAAPRHVVWKYFSEPEFLAQWFGPSSVHVDPATVVVDLRSGGSWDLDMVDNDTGDHYPIRTVLTTVIPPEYLEGTLASPDGDVTLRIWLHDHGHTTRLTLHQGPFSTSEFCKMTTDGWELSFVKIDTILAGGAA